MTKKHFNEIVEIFNLCNTVLEHSETLTKKEREGAGKYFELLLLPKFLEMFELENENFDRERFISALSFELTYSSD